MPTYRNSTAADITVGSFRFPANEDMGIDTFLESLSGLTLVSVSPQVNKNLLANVYSAKAGADIATIAVPESASKGYIINFYVESGEFQIAFNEAAMTPPFRVAEGQNWTRKYVSRVVTDIRIHCVTGGNIYVNIEKL